MAMNHALTWNFTGAYPKKVKETLEIEEHLKDIIAVEGSEVVFECKVDGQPQPICTWHKNGKPVTSDHKTSISYSRKWHRLEINNVDFTDHGVYTIVARNRTIQMSSKCSLSVSCKDLNDGVYYTHINSIGAGVMEHLREVKVEQGKRIELEATFELDAIDDNYVWLKNNEMVQQDDRTIILSSRKTTMLTILKSELRDSGVYYVVAKTKQATVGSQSTVQVTAIKEQENDISMIKETLPEEIEVNENEEITFICKAFCDIHTKIQWRKDFRTIDRHNFVVVDYNDNTIGLRGQKISMSDSGVYSVFLRNELTGEEERSTCYLTVNSPPGIMEKDVELIRPMQSALACCGSKVTFDCRFSLQDPKYFYVVWHVGHYRVERTNHRFNVVCKGGEFLLYIKKVEPGMSGKIVCELRKCINNKQNISITSCAATLDIVPACIVHQVKSHDEFHNRGKLHFEISPRENMAIASERESLETYGSNYGGYNFRPKVLMEITYCRLDEDGLYFLHVEKRQSEKKTKVVVYKKPKTTSNTIIIEWEHPKILYWYGIYLGQTDRLYVSGGLSSSPFFEVEDPPLDRILKFSIRTALPACDCDESDVNIVPTPDTVLRPVKIHFVKHMDDMALKYRKTEVVIGAGAFGNVKLIKDLKGNFYAAKNIRTYNQKKHHQAMREFELMQRLRHPKVIELIDGYTSKENFTLVMDYLWGGELFDRIIGEEHIKEIDVVPYVKQIGEALEYLHAHRIAHLDIKPENIVCLSRNSSLVKIIDFGLARVISNGTTIRAIYGTKDYVAPEVLNYDRLSLACDMWSFGVVAYMLLSGVMPFPGESWPERSVNITLCNYNYDEPVFREVSDLAKDFVDNLLVLDPRGRMTAKAALEHKWLKEGPPKGASVENMKKARANLKTYLADYRSKWHRAAHMMHAAHCFRAEGETRAAKSNANPSGT